MDLGPLLHPVGPHDPGVYWRRRLILLLAVVVVIIAVVAATSGGGGDTATVAQQPPPSGHPPTSGPSASAAATPTQVATGRPSPTPSAAGATPAACSVDALQLQAKTDQETYPTGVEPKLTLVVTNPGPAPCRIDLGSSQLELRVLSGSDRVWSSDDCAPDGAAEPSVLQPGQPWAASLTWSRTRSAPTCPSGQPKADPGTYRLYARLGSRLSAPAVFHLT